MAGRYSRRGGTLHSRLATVSLLLVVAASAGCRPQPQLDTGAPPRWALEYRWGNCVAFSPRGDLLASASRTGTVRLWAVPGMAESATLRSGVDKPASLAFSPDGSTLVVRGEDRKAEVWHVARRAVGATLRGHEMEVSCAAFSPDGRTFAIGGHDTVALWDTRGWAPRRPARRHPRVIATLAFSPDGGTLLVGYGGRTIRPWDVETGESPPPRCWVGGGIRRFARSPDGATLAVSTYGEGVKLIRSKDLAEIRTLPIDRPPRNDFAVEFHPEGKILAVGTVVKYPVEAGEVTLWDVPGGIPLRSSIDWQW